MRVVADTSDEVVAEIIATLRSKGAPPIEVVAYRKNRASGGLRALLRSADEWAVVPLDKIIGGDTGLLPRPYWVGRLEQEDWHTGIIPEFWEHV